MLAEGHERSDVVDLMMAKMPSSAAQPYRDPKIEKRFRQVVRDPFFELVDVSTRLSLVFEGKNVEGTLFLSPALVFASAKMVLSAHVLELVEVEQLGTSSLRLLLRDDMLLEFVAAAGGDVAHEALILRGLWRGQCERVRMDAAAVASGVAATTPTAAAAASAAAGFFTLEMRDNPLEFSPEYAAWSQERLVAWKE